MSARIYLTKPRDEISIQRSVCMRQADHDYVRALGAGNISLGLREIIEHHRRNPPMPPGK